MIVFMAQHLIFDYWVICRIGSPWVEVFMTTADDLISLIMGRGC